MAITKIQSNAFPSNIDLSSVDLTIGSGEITTANIADVAITHAKLHTDMDLSGKTVTLPDLNQNLTLTGKFIATGNTTEIYGAGNASLAWGDTTDIGYLSFSTGGNPIVRAGTGKDLILQTNGNNNSMVITSGGNVGMGGTNPDANLQILNNDGSSYRFGYGGSSDVYLDADNTYFRRDNGSANTVIITPSALGLGNAVLGKGNGYGGNTSAAANGTLDLYNYSTGATQLTNSGSYPIIFSTNNAERMHISAGGNVGIGIASPSGRLDIDATNAGASGDGIIIQNATSGDSSAGIFIKRGSAIATSIYTNPLFTNGNTTIMSEGGFIFRANSGNRMELDTSGNLFPLTSTQNLGTSSDPWQNVYTQDLHLSNEAKTEGNEVDGTKGNWTIQEGEEHLYIINNKNGKKFKFSLEEVE